MRTALPPLDLHAHIATDVSEDALRQLGAVIFVATRSLSEATAASRRTDEPIVWGVGSHPGLARSHNTFDQSTFHSLIKQRAFASELGLDGSSKIDLDRQLLTLRAALEVLMELPRVTSVHSYQATDLILDELGERPARGVVLHWWLGSDAATRRAVELGCYFSVNAAMVRDSRLFTQIPRDRLLTETDHPFGDRNAPQPRQPGGVASVENAIARRYGLQHEEVRRLIWANLSRLVSETGSAPFLSRRVRSYLIASMSP